MTIAVRARFEYDSSTIRARFGYNTLRDAYDSSTIRARYNILRGDQPHVAAAVDQLMIRRDNQWRI